MTSVAGKIAASIVLALFASTMGVAQSAQQVDSIFRPLASNHTPGLAVLVIKDGKTVFKKGYGIADLRTGAPITPATNFRLASFTKQFTAAAIMLLVKDGKLSYEDPLSRFFPDFPDYGRAITVRQLLNHTSGLPDYEDLWDAKHPGISADKEPQIHDAEVLQVLEEQRAGLFPPGSKWQYSNGGYVLLGLIVEKASGKSFPDFLRRRIFEPLGMRHSVAFVSGKNTVPKRAFGYRKEGDRWIFSDQSPTSATLGDGGIYSSLDDLARWDRALAQHTLLTAAEMQAALTPVSAPGVELNGKPAAYGFGWFLDAYNGRRRMYHYGETSGFHTNIQRFVDEDLTIIILSNRIDLDPGALALKVADLFAPAASH